MCPLRIFELAVVALVTLAGRVAAYSNQWAVHIEGGPEVAQQVAQEHGFQYLDKVSSKINVTVKNIKNSYVWFDTPKDLKNVSTPDRNLQETIGSILKRNSSTVRTLNDSMKIILPESTASKPPLNFLARYQALDNVRRQASLHNQQIIACQKRSVNSGNVPTNKFKLVKRNSDIIRKLVEADKVPTKPEESFKPDSDPQSFPDKQYFDRDATLLYSETQEISMKRPPDQKKEVSKSNFDDRDSTLSYSDKPEQYCNKHKSTKCSQDQKQGHSQSDFFDDQGSKKCCFKHRSVSSYSEKQDRYCEQHVPKKCSKDQKKKPSKSDFHDRDSSSSCSNKQEQYCGQEMSTKPSQCQKREPPKSDCDGRDSTPPCPCKQEVHCAQEISTKPSECQKKEPPKSDCNDQSSPPPCSEKPPRCPKRPDESICSKEQRQPAEYPKSHSDTAKSPVFRLNKRQKLPESRAPPAICCPGICPSKCKEKVEECPESNLKPCPLIVEEELAAPDPPPPRCTHWSENLNKRRRCRNRYSRTTSPPTIIYIPHQKSGKGKSKESDPSSKSDDSFQSNKRRYSLKVGSNYSLSKNRKGKPGQGGSGPTCFNRSPCADVSSAGNEGKPSKTSRKARSHPYKMAQLEHDDGGWRNQKYPIRLRIFKKKNKLDPCLPIITEIKNNDPDFRKNVQEPTLSPVHREIAQMLRSPCPCKSSNNVAIQKSRIQAMKMKKCKNKRLKKSRRPPTC